MRTIHKYQIPPYRLPFRINIETFLGFRLVLVGEQYGLLTLWCEVDISSEKIDFPIWVYGTGEAIPAGLEHMGSVVMHDNDVLHVFIEKRD